MDLTAEERVRYHRHLLLPEVDLKGQQALKSAKVICIGAGGLGSPVLLYLAAAGIGTLGVVDDDVVELSNLQRQIIYTTQDSGRAKVDCAQTALHALNPNIIIHRHRKKLTQENVMALLHDYDIVVDGTDNFVSRYVINDACFHLKKPLVSASIYRFEGQCSVFATPNGPCYRCLYPHPSSALSCSEAGVLGVLPGLLGTIQATEVIKLILNIGQPLIGRLLTVNALTMQFNEYILHKNPACALCYAFKENDMQQTPAIEEVTVNELLELQKQQKNLLVLDVREPAEYDVDNMGGKLIPIGQLPERLDELDREQLIVVHCKSGGRSSRAVAFLMGEGFKNVKNLKGGITAWREVVRNK